MGAESRNQVQTPGTRDGPSSQGARGGELESGGWDQKGHSLGEGEMSQATLPWNMLCVGVSNWMVSSSKTGRCSLPINLSLTPQGLQKY